MAHLKVGTEVVISGHSENHNGDYGVVVYREGEHYHVQLKDKHYEIHCYRCELKESQYAEFKTKT